MTAAIWILLVKILAAIGIGFLAGNGAVFCFNRLPDRWLDEKRPGDQRISGHPWKGVMSATFIVIGIYLAVMEDWQYALAAEVVCFILLLIGWADRKYRRIPSPLCLFLIALSIGFLPNRDLAFPVTLVAGILLAILRRARRPKSVPWGMIFCIAVAIYLIAIHRYLPGIGLFL